MGRCRHTSETLPQRDRTSLAKGLAPEEIRRGDFVAPLYVVHEWPSWFWCCGDDSLYPREELVRTRSMPGEEAAPLKVIEICLPFVLVETAQREGKTLDVRQMGLARLDRRFARKARRAFRRRARREKTRDRSARK
jgi:hypothetical protein